MEPITVSYDRLRQYVKKAGLYKMYEEGDNLTLIFEPTFVEASFHGTGARTFITFRREGDMALLEKFEIEDAEEKREVDLEAARTALEMWLETVED